MTDSNGVKLLMFTVVHAEYVNMSNVTVPVIVTRMTIEDTYYGGNISRFNTYSVLFSKRVDVDTINTYEEFAANDFRMTVFTKVEYERYLKAFIEKHYPESKNAVVAGGFASVLVGENFNEWWNTEGLIELKTREFEPIMISMS